MMISRSELTSQTLYEKEDLKLITQRTTSGGVSEKYTDGNIWVKADLFGYEGLSEVISSRVVKELGFNTVEYRPCVLGINKYEVKTACVSNNFIPMGHTAYTIGRLLEKSTNCSNRGELFEQMYADAMPDAVLEFVLNNMQQYIPRSELMSGMATYIWLDSLLLNTDRHIYNMVIVTDGHTNNFINFDYGASLLSDLEEFPMLLPLEEAISAAHSKPFSSYFSIQLELFDMYIPRSIKDHISIAVDDLRSYYNDSYINRCLDVLRHTLKKVGIELSISNKCYTLADLKEDTPTIMQILQKHANHIEWFNENFPNGATSVEQVLGRI